MREDECTKECTCKNSLGHYLVVGVGFLRAISVVVGVAFTANGAALNEVETYLDKIIAVVEEISDKLTE